MNTKIRVHKLRRAKCVEFNTKLFIVRFSAVRKKQYIFLTFLRSKWNQGRSIEREQPLENGE